MKKAKWTSAIMGVPHAMRLVICFSALSLIFLFVLHTLAGSVLLNNTSSHSFESLTCSLLLLSLGNLGGPGTQHFPRLSAWDSDWLGWLFAMDSNFSKQGCPKGSKDGPHPPGAPPRGCPKKSVGKDPKTSQGELSPLYSHLGQANWLVTTGVVSLS